VVAWVKRVIIKNAQNKSAMEHMADVCDSFIIMQTNLRELAAQLISQIDKEITD